jgi:peptidoglycan/LPS O-acetylase OafA/YrhL
MTQTLPEPAGNRILFLDNIRYLMIVFVVLQHTGNGYASLTSSWYVWDPATTTKLFDAIRLIIDVFIMPVLFFIAGYFTLPSIRKKGTGVFLKDKFLRLGIPWLICVIFIVPIVSYIQHYRRLGGQLLSNYSQFWLNWLRTASDLYTGFLYNSRGNLFYRSADQISFNQTAYWFISLLLFFFIIFGIIYALKKRLFPASSIQEKTHSGKTMLLVMLSVALLCIIIRASVNLLPYPYSNPWVIAAGVLQFQTWRLPAYIIYFALGIYAFSRKWFVKDNNFPGNPLLWISICVVLCFAYLAVMKSYMSNSANTELRFVSGCLLSFLRATFLIVLTSIAFRYWNRPDKINETLAANSYNIYLVHLPIVVVLQLLLVNLTGTPSLIKYGIVFSLSFPICYAISRYAIKPRPRLSVAAVAFISLLMVIFVHPHA